MGCASSKQNRTKSLEDIHAGVKASEANGRMTKDDANVKKNVDQHNAANPIQIPGANKSFLAPDGIPFIDEDVDEDDMRVRSGKTDVNENSKEAKTDDASALVSGGAAVGDQGPKVQVTLNSTEIVTVNQTQVSPGVTDRQKEEKAAIKIQAGVRGFLDRKKLQSAKQHSTPVVNEEEVKPIANHPKFDENTAATKIQANYKGYKTRKELRVGN